MNIDTQITNIVGQNSIEAYVWALGWFSFWFLVIFLIKSLITTKFVRTGEIDSVKEVIFSLLSSITTPLITIISLYIASQSLFLPEFLNKPFFVATIIIIIYQIIITVQIVADYLFHTKFKNEPATQNAFQSLVIIAKFFIAVLGFLFILQNVGINVTSLIAGLGIGGIAIALAAQNVLGDLFSSFALLFDKPFIPGDFIVVGENSGVVQKVGIKTTRIKALQGEEIIIPNNKLTSARIQNFKRMEERRVAFDIGIIYDTPLSKVKKIPTIIREIIDSEENTRFGRTHFTTFGDSALLFETVYFVTNSDYEQYMDAQQSINLKIMEEFEKNKIRFALPTRIVHLAKS